MVLKSRCFERISPQLRMTYTQFLELLFIPVNASFHDIHTWTKKSLKGMDVKNYERKQKPLFQMIMCKGPQK